LSWLPSHAELHSCLRLCMNTPAPIKLRFRLALAKRGERFRSVLTARLGDAVNDPGQAIRQSSRRLLPAHKAYPCMSTRVVDRSTPGALDCRAERSSLYRRNSSLPRCPTKTPSPPDLPTFVIAHRKNRVC